MKRIKELYEDAWNIVAERFEMLEEILKDFKDDDKIRLKLHFTEKQRGEMPFDVTIAHLRIPISDERRGISSGNSLRAKLYRGGK